VPLVPYLMGKHPVRAPLQEQGVLENEPVEKKGDMNYWICSECNYVCEAEKPPQLCPICHEKCAFADVTCYVPECGGPGHVDTRLVAQRVRESRKSTG